LGFWMPRAFTSAHLEDNTTQTPDIHLTTVSLRGDQNLGSHPKHRSLHCGGRLIGTINVVWNVISGEQGGVRSALTMFTLGDSEIGDLADSFKINKNIIRLQILEAKSRQQCI
jgi:hypothetical protein